ncbi:hypothetical protein GCM10018790_00270 [Kitasatospora xanthocidica]|uniref:hypothetical protein n=1 Tax=Kitasatospora xanthocidica TaxID=83382 RepID=UPI001673DE99|nr:hypothetical protein [Kitasatospora xanthocidica]GHF26951.1 hypothetical protein GCM10018790_00270 [Kitasatospora xanthocidica]
MSTNRSRRIDRDAAEQLLGGAVAAPSAGQDASLTGPDGGPGQLARVLAAAAAPATAGELAGEEAALAAFREASLTPDPVVTPIRRRSMATAALARAFSTKAAAAVLGATALCGVAVAAGTGNLSSLGGGPSEPERPLAAQGGAIGTSPGAPGHGSAAAGVPFAPASGSARPSDGASTGPRTAPPTGTATPGTPSAEGRGDRSTVPPALLGLCRGFADRTAKGERPGRLVTEPLYGPLVTAAEGADRVADYCAEAIGEADDDHQGTTAKPRDPAHTGATSGTSSGTGSGKGNTDGGKSGGGNGGGEDTGGSGTRPGKTGTTVPTLPAAPTVPEVRPSKPDRSGNEQSSVR